MIYLQYKNCHPDQYFVLNGRGSDPKFTDQEMMEQLTGGRNAAGFLALTYFYDTISKKDFIWIISG